MINRRISAILAILLLFAFLANSSYSQKRETGSEGISTTMVVSAESILPYESLSVMLVLRNETMQPKRVVASWCACLSIGEIAPAGAKWRSYMADNEPITKPPIPTAKDFAPGEAKKLFAHIDYESPSGEHVFARPGKYLLQGSTLDNGKFVSDKIEITVRKPLGIDARAYEFLQHSSIHRLFGEYTIHKYTYDRKTVQDIEKFIADFDGSEYSNLARIGLAFMWLRGVEGKQDQSRAIELLTYVADRADGHLSSQAEYHLGTILERQKNDVQANYHFQKVLAGTSPLYFRYLAEEALRQR